VLRGVQHRDLEKRAERPSASLSCRCVAPPEHRRSIADDFDGGAGDSEIQISCMANTGRLAWLMWACSLVHTSVLRRDRRVWALNLLLVVPHLLLADVVSAGPACSNDEMTIVLPGGQAPDGVALTFLVRANTICVE